MNSSTSFAGSRITLEIKTNSCHSPPLNIFAEIENKGAKGRFSLVNVIQIVIAQLVNKTSKKLGQIKVQIHFCSC